MAWALVAQRNRRDLLLTPVKFDLVINMKTAKALGLDVPVHLQQRAKGSYRNLGVSCLAVDVVLRSQRWLYQVLGKRRKLA